ncbi:telomere binding protein [Collariella sp. IMI 366227]|nr:telomere binding protein [Collariella sp. IMI 366227]
MDELLTQASVIRKSQAGEDDNFLELSVQESSGSRDAKEKAQIQQKPPSSPEDALEALRHEPDYDSLISVLNFLSRHETPGSSFPFIKLPGPKAAQLVQVLVLEIVPNYWALLVEDVHQAKISGLKLLLYCLSSITGINAILVRLKALIQEAKTEATTKVRRPDISLNLGILLDLLCRVLQGDGWLPEAWKIATMGQEGLSRVRPRVQEIVATFGGGRVISLAAEAEEVAKSSNSSKMLDNVWPADSLQYAQWLGRNITTVANAHLTPEEMKFGSDLFAKGLRLGHSDTLIKQLISELVLKNEADPEKFGLLLNSLPLTEQRKVLSSVLKLFSAEHLDRLGQCESDDTKPVISAVAGSLSSILASNDNGKRCLVEWLTASSGAGLGEGVGIRRAVLAVISQQRDDLVTVLEKSLSQFGDQLYIKHSPTLQQEGPAPGRWRARFLGMVVGEALSGLVDKGDKRLNFKMEETDQGEGRWYKSLTEVSDKIGTLDPLRKAPIDIPCRKPQAERVSLHRPAPQPPRTGFIIEELSDEEGLEEEHIVPYAKPDSDAEDSDDDATLVTRNKPKAPVYIRDLIKYLRDTESYDHQKLALTTAPTLIRRKADFGTEVSEHAEELATLLVGLSDKFEIDNFDDLRVQGMIALVVAKSAVMGLWFAKTFFDGDYSISQRASILVVLGLSAREVAGFETSEYAAAASFPSKSLPERVECLYLGNSPSKQSSSVLKALPPNALDHIATSLTSKFLAPLAATAADAATGPDILKLSTFTSRLDQQQPDDNQPNNPKIKYKSARGIVPTPTSAQSPTPPPP